MRLAIPTYVGGTPSSTLTRTPSTCHPHLRGGYSHIALISAPFFLPSPLTWGVRGQRPERCSSSLAIPTYVGGTDDGRVGAVLVNLPSPPTWGLHFRIIEETTTWTPLSVRLSEIVKERPISRRLPTVPDHTQTHRPGLSHVGSNGSSVPG